MILKNKVIVVTGGSGLIGRSIVDTARSYGAIVVDVDVQADSDLSKGKIRCDITAPESVDAALNEIQSQYDVIDGWVNCAYPRTSDWGTKFEDVPYASWAANVDMQMNSTFYICQKVLEQMRKQGSGSLVNIASIYGVVGNDFTVYDNTGGMTSPAAYSAIKGGIINFTRYCASYYGRFNVRVNSVSPGGVKDRQHPEFIKNFEQKVPLKRMARPDEIGPPVCFLLSDDSSYITGHNLMVDGGWTAI